MNHKRNTLIALAIAAIGLSGATQAHQQRDTWHKSDAVCHDGRHQYRDGHRNTDRHSFACKVDRRQANQERRIRAGLHKGDLTRGEARKLRREQDKIERMEARYTADGHLSKKERIRIDRALDRASERIYAARHNDWERSEGHAPRRHDGDRVSFFIDYRDR